ncbi:MAG: glycosyltransferase [Frankiales bacterium]|nr:glycosyltransferase [Frankiales bacterium]
MRIVHISDCYLPRLGGIETQVRALATRQVLAGHDVHVVTATPGDDVRRGTETLDGVVVHRATARMPADLPVHPRVTRVVRDLLADGGEAAGADAVHVHGGVVSPFAYPGARVARRLGLPTVVTIHGVWGGVFGPAARLSDLVTGWSRSGVVLTAVSDAAADPIRAIAGPGTPVTLVPNGIDVEQWRVPHLAGDPDEVRLVAVMRLAPRKRALPLVRMVHEASRFLPPGRRLRLTLVGNGPLMANVERYVARHGLDDGVCSVELVGRLGPDDVRATLAASDAFVAPAHLESFGIAALEARTAGLPVLAYASTGIASFVHHEVEGLLAADDRRMVDAIARIATDDDLRARIAQHNATTEPEQSWPRVLAAVEAAYAEAARPTST